MKALTVLAFTLVSSTVAAEQKIVSLDMEPGYWETSTQVEQSQQLKDMLANLPDNQRDLVLQQMGSSLGARKSSQCITKESIQNMGEFIRDSLGSHSNSCELEVTESSKTELIAKMNCQGVPTTMHTKVINSRKHESVASSSVPGMGETKVNMIAEWKSATCPSE